MANWYRSALTVARRIRHGRQYLLESTSAWTAPRTTGTLVYTSPLCDLRILIVRGFQLSSAIVTDAGSVWQWDQLRGMKVGGNESATKYFQTHGGGAALASKDPKTKYTSNAATKYKEELNKRTAADVQRYEQGVPPRQESVLTKRRFPNEVIITDVPDATPDASSDAASNNDDDFFSSWDKPTIKRPSNPPSRTATPSQQNRSQSPFLNPNANGNGVLRPKSPLANATSEDTSAPKVVPSTAVRKSTTTTTGPKKNILGAKKTTKLGAKKVAASDDLDFDAAEKKAREEAERIEKLGYDPDAEQAPVEPKPNTPTATNIASPTPISPRASFGGAGGRPSADVERLGAGVQRLGFGMVGAGTKAAAAPAPTSTRSMAFGSAGSSRPTAEDSERGARDKFGQQKGISSDEYFGRNQFDPNAQSEAKNRLQGFEGAQSISSNAYFGRPEEDENQDDYGDLESAAKDFVRKFGITAGDDLENVTQLLGDGATRLQGVLHEVDRRMI